MKFLSSPLMCDECHRVIKNNDEGMVEWIDSGTIQDVRIVHNPVFSSIGNCYKHSHHPHRNENHLADVLSNVELRKSLGIN